jgi:multidrug transporter EmrE-like cation transporter
MDWARAGGYVPAEPYKFLEWVPHWFSRTFTRDLDISRSLAAIAVSSVTIVAISLKNKNFKNAFPSLWITSPILAALVYWFFTAPDGRFAFALWYGLGILFLTYMLYAIQTRRAELYGNIGLLILLCVLSVTVVNDNVKKISEIPVGLSYPGLQKSQVRKDITSDGYFYYETIAGDCSDSPLPCGKPPKIFIEHNKDFFNSKKD